MVESAEYLADVRPGVDVDEEVGRVWVLAWGWVWRVRLSDTRVGLGRCHLFCRLPVIRVLYTLSRLTLTRFTFSL